MMRLNNFAKVAVIILTIVLVYAGVNFSVCFYKYGNYSFKLPKNDIKEDSDKIVRFSNGLKFKTISNADYQKTDFKEFDKFIQYIEKTYPLIYKKCDVKRVNKYNIVIKFKGKNDFAPNLLTAHYDVVGVQNDKNWKYKPFSGFFDKKYIYSRGTIDDKESFFAILEALNDMLKENFQPQNDMYFAFSHCEETGSNQGAKTNVEYFKKHNIRFNTILDEGGRLVDKNGKIYAFVGTGEKGRLLTKVTIYGDGGHASMPGDNLTVNKMAKVIAAFKNNKSNAIYSEEINDYYKRTFASYDLYTKFLISNREFLSYFLTKKLSKDKEDDARIHTTYAITVINASKISNVISPEITITIDSRILPGDSIQNTKKHIETVLEKTLDKKSYKIEYIDELEPSKASNISNKEYSKISSNIQAIYPNVIVAPYLTLGATDAREYSVISDNAYRFLPIVLTPDEALLMHNDNERISIENWQRMIRFYKEFIKTR